MKIAFFDVEDWQAPIIKQRCKEAGLDLVKISPNTLEYSDIPDIKDVDILSVFLSRVDQKIIENIPNLKLISARAAGVDAIDKTMAQQKNITMINVPSYGADTVAQYAMTLLLMLSRRLTMTVEQSICGVFDQKITRGNDVAGKTLGIIGAGQIGQKLVKMAHGFDMNILCYDATHNQELCSKYQVQFAPLEVLFKNSDLISIHLPYTEETHHLINFGTLNLLKKGVLIVNTSRGPIVNISAIRKGLQEEIIAGVALDTFEGEHIWTKEETILDKNYLPSAETFRKGLEAFSLLKFKNVILTPHNAFNSYEATQRILETALTDIVNFAQNNTVKHTVM